MFRRCFSTRKLLDFQGMESTFCLIHSLIHSLELFDAAVFGQRQLTRPTIERMFLFGFVVSFLLFPLSRSSVFCCSIILSIHKQVRDRPQDPPPRDARLGCRGCGKFALFQEAQAAPLVRPWGMVASQRIQHLRVVFLEKQIEGQRLVRQRRK